MKITTGAALVAGLAFSLGAFAASGPEGRRDISTFEKAAGANVQEMPATALVDWQALGDHSVAVWTANDKPWLVKVDAPCDSAVDGAGNIALTSVGGAVKVGESYLEVGDQHCKVASIQPIDYTRIASVAHTHAHRAAKGATPGA